MTQRDTTKRYVVTGAYVPMRSMTADGVKVVGYAAGSTVPAELDQDTFDHLLSHGLIAAEGDQPVVSSGAGPEQLAAQARGELAAARVELANAQARVDNAQSAVKAAEAGAEHARKVTESRAADQDAARARLAESGGPSQPASGDGPDDKSGVVPPKQQPPKTAASKTAPARTTK